MTKIVCHPERKASDFASDPNDFVRFLQCEPVACLRAQDDALLVTGLLSQRSKTAESYRRNHSPLV